MSEYSTLGTQEKKILAEIPSGSKVLDLGCGDGALLERLKTENQVEGYGVDIDFDNILANIRRGTPVFHGNIAEILSEFSDNSYDAIILSQTLQQVERPLYVLKEMMRVGKISIVTFPNFAFWKIRLQLLMGITPKTPSLPYSWYETPNIRIISIKAFKNLCKKNDIRIVKEIPLYRWSWLGWIIPAFLSNVFSRKGMFILAK